MKNLLFIVSSLLIFSISCSKEKTTSDIVDTWKLVEMLSDPGNGSGTFQAVSSNKTISFFEDGTVTSNGIICHHSTQTGTASSGSYSLVDSTITVPNCLSTNFEFDQGYLILVYPCIEPCKSKYERL